MNAVLRSLDLQEGDEVLCLNLTYPAVLNTLRHICYCTQEFVELKVVDVTLPVPTYEVLVQQVAASITSNTRLAVLDHIASATGFVLPLEKLIPLFHSKGIPVLVDGASAPGQLPLNLKALGADFYVGNCYKWLFGSKSCAFLHVNKEYQTTVRPAVTSLCYGQSFVEDFSVQGTRDEANFLTIVTALDFYASVGFERVYQYNKNLMTWATEYLSKLWNTHSLLPEWQRAPFVSNVRLPIEWPVKNNHQPLTKEEVIIVCDAIMDLLLDHFGIVVRVGAFQGEMYARISAQMYNEKADYEKLGAAVLKLTKTKTLVDHLAELSIEK
jgi:isopenicillin-N epimerase